MQVSFKGAVLAFLLLIMGLVAQDHFMSRTEASQADKLIEQLPEQFGSWTMIASHGLASTSRDILSLDRYIKRTYRRDDGRTVFLYVGYWKKQSGDSQGAKHSPRMCLPSNGWVTTRLDPQVIGLNNDGALTVSSLVGEITQTKTLFDYWFFTGDKVYYQDWKALITISIERVVSGRSDGGIVEVSTPIESNRDYPSALRDAQTALDDFTKSFWPTLKAL